MQIAQDSVALIDYKLTNDAGDVIDSSEGGAPLAYLHGHSNIIPGLEKALVGKVVGDSLKVIVEPAEGYGEVNPSLLETVPRNLFQGVDNIEVGMQFQAQTAQGTQVITVKAVDGEEVTVDGNHPLAGQTLHFDVTVTEVREASAEELEHGHVHGVGGHQH
ncbi:FKBP-type peptidyl prolyl cis-trans isomerase /apo-metallochaperone SlyD [Paraperlucidibaca baekdonensis]|uniref:Peptidyl-prolyl cis-trans isomerase n=1 Tax=Paraperlucidibaca baekdonensis TaxID=748120 RepID=A0A3E0H469_9GAMM|nr:peptidylprolyl isomerase [Paraperlucidibaca baekdonensis]REH37941.1 FKBP-type peptidyl prolyl cis-trans isomerase /apo-metallochaperone SlyD [Paraperlucidibaca baekdonensis]